MRTHVDWLTFTIPMVYFGAENDAYAQAISSGFEDMFGRDVRAIVFGGEWEKQERSRAPYVDAWVQSEGGITLFASPNLTHACVEISGQGCERLLADGTLLGLLRLAKDRVTRIDIACDIETAVRPDEFAKAVTHDRMRTSGHVISDTGETYYVGSQKSERFARVYRYNEPHPRAHLLRVEHVFRKDYAKKVCSELVDKSLESVANASGLAFGWAHPLWRPFDAESGQISVVSERRGTGATVFWLIHSCASAFKRLCDDGTIPEPEEFLKRYFLGDAD